MLYFNILGKKQFQFKKEEKKESNSMFFFLKCSFENSDLWMAIRSVSFVYFIFFYDTKRITNLNNILHI